MSVENFITFCKTKIAAYASIDASTIFTLWKDFWTVGSTMDGTQSLDNQRAIFGRTDNNTLYDMTYSAQSNTVYMKVLTQTAQQNYTVNS